MRPSATMQVAGLTWRQKSHDHWWAQSGEIRFDAKHVNRLWRVTISDVLLAVSPDLRESIQSAVDVAVSSLRTVADKLEAHRGQPVKEVALGVQRRGGLFRRIWQRIRGASRSSEKRTAGPAAPVDRSDAEIGAFIRQNADAARIYPAGRGRYVIDWLRESGVPVNVYMPRPAHVPATPEQCDSSASREG